MGKPKGVVLYQFSVIIIIVSTIMTCLGSGNLTVGCFEKERLALLKFKYSVKDYNNRLSSWVGSDCCKWFGVGCDGVTRHVVSLHLRSISWDGIDFHSRHSDFFDEHFSNDFDSLDAVYLEGRELNSALAELRYLKYMDVSSNDFQFSEIPEFIGSLKQLRFLNLSHARFFGNIPHHLGNLSNLNVLDLGFNMLMADDLTWLSGLSSLKHIDLSKIEFSQTQNLNKLLNLNMPSLVELHLSESENLNVQVDPSLLNSSSMLANIQLLDLSWCYFGGNSFPSFLRNMTSLVSLDLSGSDLSQPHSFENLLNIVPFASELHFSICFLQNTHLSRIHVNASKYSNIQYLDLSQNDIFGEFPPFLMNMSSLSSLDLLDNFLNSSVPVMSGLLTLKLSYNNYNHIRHIGLWKQCHLKLLRVDHNHIQKEMIGPSTNISECSRYAMEVLDLSWNELNGSQLPESFGKFKALRELNLENSQLMGPIPTSIGKLTALKVLYLNDNQLTGPIPTSLGRLASLQKLSVSSNLLNV
ncbi:leucine-rich repeat protein [Artemisia annua]|uniref:Leucine-rich repeat protein n=1 Tax=Artemisia annua TaxID=35608 RepID=A0A2U1KGD3_ARTAN|nr:leucine-rich repeat protein [Artemisia annua]